MQVSHNLRVNTKYLLIWPIGRLQFEFGFMQVSVGDVWVFISVLFDDQKPPGFSSHFCPDWLFLLILMITCTTMAASSPPDTSSAYPDVSILQSYYPLLVPLKHQIMLFHTMVDWILPASTHSAQLSVFLSIKWRQWDQWPVY